MPAQRHLDEVQLVGPGGAAEVEVLHAQEVNVVVCRHEGWEVPVRNSRDGPWLGGTGAGLGRLGVLGCCRLAGLWGKLRVVVVGRWGSDHPVSFLTSPYRRPNA